MLFSLDPIHSNVLVEVKSTGGCVLLRGSWLVLDVRPSLRTDVELNVESFTNHRLQEEEEKENNDQHPGQKAYNNVFGGMGTSVRSG